MRWWASRQDQRGVVGRHDRGALLLSWKWAGGPPPVGGLFSQSLGGGNQSPLPRSVPFGQPQTLIHGRLGGLLVGRDGMERRKRKGGTGAPQRAWAVSEAAVAATDRLAWAGGRGGTLPLWRKAAVGGLSPRAGRGCWARRGAAAGRAERWCRVHPQGGGGGPAGTARRGRVSHRTDAAAAAWAPWRRYLPAPPPRQPPPRVVHVRVTRA